MASAMSSSRILFTCRPLSGHFDPLLPLADAARTAGHLVAFASGEPVVGRARDAGYLAFEAGPAESFRAEWAPRFPHFRTLVGNAQREFFFTEIFANLELAPRAIDLESIMSAWRPRLVVHEIAELAAPLVSTSLGIPYVDVGYSALVPRALLTSAGAAAAPHWRARQLEPHPLAGLLRHVYIDPCPPALQNPEIADVAAVQQLRPIAVHEHVDERPEWLRGLPHEQTVYVTLGTIWNTDIDLFRLVLEALRDRLNLIITIGRQTSRRCSGPSRRGSSSAATSLRTNFCRGAMPRWFTAGRARCSGRSPMACPCSCCHRVQINGTTPSGSPRPAPVEGFSETRSLSAPFERASHRY
jgi:UDP:flavonoid glycosyltransferase YjiC (YdhE family)